MTREDVVERTGWPVRFADGLTTTSPATADELTALRDLKVRTERAHRG